MRIQAAPSPDFRTWGSKREISSLGQISRLGSRAKIALLQTFKQEQSQNAKEGESEIGPVRILGCQEVRQTSPDCNTEPDPRNDDDQKRGVNSSNI